MKSRSSGGWFLSGVTTRELEIEGLMLLISENTKEKSALFMSVIALIKSKKAGDRVNCISFDFILVVGIWQWRAINPVIVRYIKITEHDYPY
jgi:hypothetical protein